MKIKQGQEQAWAECVTINSNDAYSKACVDFALAWADSMEVDLTEGRQLHEIAEKCSQETDKYFGITGFMYGAAVSMLSKFWEHGEALRRWHNIDTQIGNEGEKANESGGVLNPALLTIGG